MSWNFGSIKLWATMATVVVLLLAVLAWLNPNNSNQSAASPRPEIAPEPVTGSGAFNGEGNSVQTSTSAQSRSQSELLADKDSRESQALSSAAQATSASQLQRLAQEALETGDVDLVGILELIEDTFCGPLLREDLAPEVDRGSEAFNAMASFCADANIDLASDGSTERTEYLAWLSDRQELAEDQFSQLVDLMSPETAFLAMLEEAGSPLEVDVLALVFVRRMGINLPAYLLPHLGPLDYEERFNLNDLLLRFYSCEKFRHCGPDHMKTIESCLFGHCAQEGDYLDLLRWHSSPREIAIVEAMLEEINRRRALGWHP